MSRLFGNKVPPACEYCTQAMQRLQGRTVLCGKRGVVMEDHSCRLFLYDPLKRIPKPQLPMQQFDKSEFEL